MKLKTSKERAASKLAIGESQLLRIAHLEGRPIGVGIPAARVRYVLLRRVDPHDARTGIASCDRKRQRTRA